MKPRFRLLKISQIPDGTRFWFARGLSAHKPFTLITKAKRKGEAIYHVGHDFNLTARRLRTFDARLVWVRVL